MNWQLYVIALILSILVLALIVGFSRANSRLKKQHLQTCAETNVALFAHKKQIYLRNRSLHSYNFLTRNLKDVFLVQTIPDPIHS